LVYKFEGFELFKSFIAKVNEDTVSFYLREIFTQKSRRNCERQAVSRPKQVLKEKKEEAHSVLGAPNISDNRPPVERERVAQYDPKK
jgi:preprotein translocase subunit SecA